MRAPAPKAARTARARACSGIASAIDAGPRLGQVLPDRDPLHPLRRGGGLPLSVGGELPPARDVRLRRDADLRARAGARLRLRVAQGRARVELTAAGRRPYR